MLTMVTIASREPSAMCLCCNMHYTILSKMQFSQKLNQMVEETHAWLDNLRCMPGLEII